MILLSLSFCSGGWAGGEAQKTFPVYDWRLTGRGWVSATFHQYVRQWINGVRRTLLSHETKTLQLALTSASIRAVVDRWDVDDFSATRPWSLCPFQMMSHVLSWALQDMQAKQEALIGNTGAAVRSDVSIWFLRWRKLHA